MNYSIQKLKLLWLLSKPKKKGVVISHNPNDCFIFINNNSCDDVYRLGKELDYFKKYFEIIINFDLGVLDQIISEIKSDLD